MASKVKTFKLQTFDKLKKFKTEFPNKKEFKKSTQYVNFVNSFLNSVERDSIDDIVDMFYAGKSYDEIRNFIQEKENAMIDRVFSDGATADTGESAEEKEAFLILSKNKVIEVEPVSVLVGEEEFDENNTATSDDLDDVTDMSKTRPDQMDAYETEPNEEPVTTLKAIVEDRKHNTTNDSTVSVDKNSDATNTEEKPHTWEALMHMIEVDEHRDDLMKILIDMISSKRPEDAIINDIYDKIQKYKNEKESDMSNATGGKVTPISQIIRNKVGNTDKPTKSTNTNDDYVITCGVANETIFSRLSAIF